MGSETDIQHDFKRLSSDKFTGESVLRFLGSNFEGVHVLPRDYKEDGRPDQNIETIVDIFSLCREFGAFGSITLIWHEGAVKNYTVKLTFQGKGALFQAKRIFQLF